MSEKRKYTPQQIAIIRRKKIEEAAEKKAAADRVRQEHTQNTPPQTKEEPRKRFPFWMRLKISKNRTTLVIDEDQAYDKQKKEMVDGYVHREATHTENKDYEKIEPNPDKDDPKPMYLKRPRKLPKRLFMPHNKDLDMPEHLRERYDKNNKKDE